MESDLFGARAPSALLLSDRAIVSHLRGITAKSSDGKRHVSTIFTHKERSAYSATKGRRKQSRGAFVRRKRERERENEAQIRRMKAGTLISRIKTRHFSSPGVESFVQYFVYTRARARARICVRVRVYRGMEVGKPVLVSSCVASPARYTMPVLAPLKNDGWINDVTGNKERTWLLSGIYQSATFLDLHAPLEWIG